MPDISRPFDDWLLSDLADKARITGAAHACAESPPTGPVKPGPLPTTLRGALWRGLKGLCPVCGTAKLFGNFLKTVPHCPTCAQDWSHQRADDFPPYIVILALGHVIVPGMAVVEMTFHPPMWVHLALWLPLVSLLGASLLQPAKGGVIAYQWWHGMGGFGDRESGPDTPDSP